MASGCAGVAGCHLRHPAESKTGTGRLLLVTHLNRMRGQRARRVPRRSAARQMAEM